MIWKHMRGLVGVAAVAAMGACSPKAVEEAPVEAVEPQPDPAYAANFPDCTWGEVQSAGISVWGFDCAQSRLVADPALPGISLEYQTPEGSAKAPLIVIFPKAETDPLDAVLPAVRAASPGSATATCAFEEVPEMVSFYQFMPTGEARKAYDALISSSGTEPEDADYMPCGDWGPSESGMRVFTVVTGAGDKVAGVRLPSDLASFDVRTLRKTEPSR